MADQNKNLTSAPPSAPTAVIERPKIVAALPPTLIDNAQAQLTFNQKNEIMVKIQQEMQDAKDKLKSELPTPEKTPDSKLLAGAKAVTAAAILSTSGLAQETMKPKVQPVGEVQFAPTEMASEEELFMLAKYRDRDRLERWPTLTSEQKNRVLHYFALGKKMNLDERGMKRFGLKLMSFYETVNEQKKIIMGDNSVKSALSLTIIGGDLEEILPGSGFAKKGVELDSAIIAYLDAKGAEADKRGAEADKRGAEADKRGAEAARQSAEIQKQTDILRMLIKRLEQL